MGSTRRGSSGGADLVFTVLRLDTDLQKDLRPLPGDAASRIATEDRQSTFHQLSSATSVSLALRRLPAFRVPLLAAPRAARCFRGLRPERESPRASAGASSITEAPASDGGASEKPASAGVASRVETVNSSGSFAGSAAARGSAAAGARHSLLPRCGLRPDRHPGMCAPRFAVALHQKTAPAPSC